MMPAGTELFLVPDEPDHVRLARFRAKHPPPRVKIREGEFGEWQGIVRTRNGETVRTGHTLRELLDKMDELFPPDDS